MRMLITNDDGIYSPGIAVLADVAGQYGDRHRGARRGAIFHGTGDHFESPFDLSPDAAEKFSSISRQWNAGGLCCSRSAPVGERGLGFVRRKSRPEPRDWALAFRDLGRSETGGSARPAGNCFQHTDEGPTMLAARRGRAVA